MKPLPSQANTGHRARKRFGQNFLISEQVIQDIINAVSAKQSDHIVEIGPGLGVLTEPLVNSGAQVTAIELDRDLAARLESKFAGQSNFNLINKDALALNYADLCENNIRVVGNLPYNISTPIMFRLLESSSQIEDMHFMLQKEVVKRLAAQPGTSAWGRLGIIVQYHCQVEDLIDVPPESFDPPPKVDSAVVRLSPCEPPTKAKNIDRLEKVVRIAFNKRRKTLRNALRDLYTEQQMLALDIDPSLRPENLTLEQYLSLANQLDD